MAGAYKPTNTGDGRGGYQDGNGRTASRRRQERDRLIAEREKKKKAAESVGNLFDASCMDTGYVMRQVYRVTDVVGLTDPYVRVNTFLGTLENAIIDTLVEVKDTEGDLKGSETRFNEEEAELQRINNDYAEAETVYSALKRDLKNLKNERKTLAAQKVDLEQAEENTENWKELEDKLTEKNNEIKDLEKDIEDHEEDMNELMIEMIQTDKEYEAAEAIKITYKNRLVDLRQTRDKLEYIKIVLQPYVERREGTNGKSLSAGKAKAKGLIQQGSKLIDVIGDIAANTEDDSSGQEDDGMNIGDLSTHKPKEKLREDQSVLKDRFEKIREKLIAKQHDDDDNVI